jgi:pilus assembly protein FimV
VTSRASRTHKTQSTLGPRSLASAIVIALASLSAAPAVAAGLGRLAVQSALGQPLRAEVEVTALTREEAQTLSARLASPDAFRQAGLEYNPALSGLRFAIVPRNGRTYVQISSSQPINEPFVDLLLELNWATGKFVREYTFLLDPPELRQAREAADGGAQRADTLPASSAPVAPRAEAPAVTPVPVPVAPRAEPAPPQAATPVPAAEPAAARPAPEPSRASSPAVEPSASATPARPPRATPRPAADAAATGSIEVRRGDTLGNITRGVLPEGVSLDQAMVAIYRANPAAFIGNLNLVREGARLSIPDAGAMGAIDSGEARRIVRMQSADFAAYRQRLAAAPGTVEGPRSGQSAAGAVGGQVVDRSGSAAGDQLRLSKPGAAGEAGAPLGATTNRSGEAAVARGAALREANSRIVELEKNVGELQKLLELKNRSMADLQKQLDEARAAGKAVTGAVGGAAGAAAGAAAAAKSEAPKPAPAVEAPKAEAPKAEAPKAEAPKAEAPKSEAPIAAAPVVPPAPAAETPPAPVAAAPKPAAPVPLQVEEPGFFDDLLENPFVLPGLGGIALLGAGYGLYAMRRRRRVEKFEDSLIAADAFTSNSLFGSTGGQSVDTSNTAFASGASASSLDVHSTEVDPIAEADVYIAYGREAQAEDILKEALKRQPDRQAIRSKLAEIYSGRKDVAAFEGVAREMYDMTAGRNEEWPKVATMGLALDPGNRLYSGSASGGEPSPTPGAIAAGAAAMAAAAASAAAARAEVEPPAVDRESPKSPGAFDLAAAPAEPVVDELSSLDFDLNLDTRIDQAAASDGAGEPTLSPSAEAGLGPLSEGIGERFDLPTLELDDRSSLGESLDIDLPALESLTQTGSSPDTGLDLSSISLDLEPATATVEVDEAEASAGGSGRWQEMATKLDLASAYEEIGDKEGARELLQEVIKGGDSGQQQKARAMLSKIG